MWNRDIPKSSWESSIEWENSPLKGVNEDRVNVFVAALTWGSQTSSPQRHPLVVEYEEVESLWLNLDDLFEKIHESVWDAGLFWKEVTLSISVRNVEEMQKVMKLLVQTILLSDRKSFYGANIVIDLLVKDTKVVGDILEQDIEEHLALLIQDGKLRIEEVNFLFCRDSKVNPDERYVDDGRVVWWTLTILWWKSFVYALWSSGNLKVSAI